MTEIVSIKTSVGKINLFATLKGFGTTKTFNLPHYMYNVMIWSGNGKMSVVFHDSNANYNKNIKTMNEEALKDVLRCVLDDIMLYLNDECENNRDRRRRGQCSWSFAGTGSPGTNDTRRAAE